MSGLLDIALRPTLVLLLALAGAWMMRRRSAAVRHAVLTAGVMAALVAGPAFVLLPGWDLSWPNIRRPTVSIEIADAAEIRPLQTPAVGTGWDLSSWAPGLWSAGVTFFIAKLLFGAVGLAIATLNATPAATRWQTLAEAVATGMGLRRRVRVSRTPSRRGPAAWSVMRPMVLLPAGADGWTDDRARMVLRHELAHVARGDWIVQMASDLLRAIWWFNPLAWMARTELRRLGELACDDAVLAGRFDAGCYAGELLAIARDLRRPLSAVAVSMARPSTLERRVTAMLAPDVDRRPVSVRMQLMVAAAALVALLPFSALRVTAQGGSGALGVHVFDPSGAVLPGVAVSLKEAGQSTRSATTDASGRAAFEGVAAGDYTLED